ncbi:Uncharacterised protein [Mycobacteroides abscessus]|nr:Uncharacterised protein [Mycobacteroides abscessus]
MQHSQPLRGTGERHIEFSGATRTVGQDTFRFHHQHRVELEPLGLRGRHCARHTRWADHHTGTLTTFLVQHEFFYGF